MSNTYPNSDWKLFRQKLPMWQENVMKKLIEEYKIILSQNEKFPSDIFWQLDKRIAKDKRKTGVVAHQVSRRNMEILLLDLIREGAITLEDLSEFSDNLQERIQFITSYWS